MDHSLQVTILVGSWPLSSQTLSLFRHSPSQQNIAEKVRHGRHKKGISNQVESEFRLIKQLNRHWHWTQGKFVCVGTNKLSERQKEYLRPIRSFALSPHLKTRVFYSRSRWRKRQIFGTYIIITLSWLYIIINNTWSCTRSSQDNVMMIYLKKIYHHNFF